MFFPSFMEAEPSVQTRPQSEDPPQPVVWGAEVGSSNPLDVKVFGNDGKSSEFRLSTQNSRRPRLNVGTLLTCICQ